MGSWTISVASVNLGTNELLILLDFKVDLEALTHTRIFPHQIVFFFFLIFEGKGVIDESMACPSWCSLQAVAIGAAGGSWKCNAPSPRLRPGLRVRSLGCSTLLKLSG